MKRPADRIRTQCSNVSQKITSYHIACTEDWCGNDPSDPARFPVYLANLYTDIEAAIQKLYDELTEAHQARKVVGDEHCQLEERVRELEWKLRASKKRPGAPAEECCSSDISLDGMDEVCITPEVKTPPHMDSLPVESANLFPSINATPAAKSLPKKNKFLSDKASVSKSQKAKDNVLPRDCTSHMSLPSIATSTSSYLVASPRVLLAGGASSDDLLLSQASTPIVPPHCEESPHSTLKLAHFPSKARMNTSWRSNIGYPYGSSFPQLPPIPKKRRLMTSKRVDNGAESGEW